MRFAIGEFRAARAEKCDGVTLGQLPSLRRTREIELRMLFRAPARREARHARGAISLVQGAPDQTVAADDKDRMVSACHIQFQ